MKSSILKKSLAAIPLVLGLALVFHTATAQSNYGNGIWWTQLDSAAKHIYIEGLIVGINLGRDQAFKRMRDTDCPNCDPSKIYMWSEPNLFNADVVYSTTPRVLGSNQIVSKLDSLYKDSRNSKISIYYAVWAATYILGRGTDQGMDLIMEQIRNTAR